MIQRALFILLLFGSAHLTAQAQMQASVWQIAQAIDTGSGQAIAYHGTFHVGSDVVRWQQRNKAVDYVFNLTGVSGSWTDVSKDGSAVLNILFRGSPGTITFSGTGGSRQIRIRVSGRAGSEVFPFLFLAESVQPL